MTFGSLSNPPNSTPNPSAPANTASSSDDYREEYTSELVGKWDMLVDWGNRDAEEASFFPDLLRSHGARTVLDAAVGTGYHAWLLARAGFEVTASDGALTMVRRCQANLAERDINLPVFEADWRSLTQATDQRFDAVLCLGNSFSHLFDAADRARTLEQFRAVLNPGGILVLDHRNYDKILTSGFAEQRTNYCCGASDVVIGAAAVGEGLVRLRYQFPDDTNYDVTQYPMRQAETTDLLRAHGFESVTSYGDLHREFALTEPDWIVHLARAAAVPE